MHLLVGRSVRYICFGVLSTFVIITFLSLYICSNQTCSFYRFDFLNNNYPPVRWRKLRANRQLLSNRTFQNSFDNNDHRHKITVAKSDFDIRGSDVIVFLHIQNTGGSVFARHMVEDLQLERPCRCRKNRRVCRCYRPGESGYGSTWFFSRYTTGWKCGVHPDWAELSTCVDGVMDEDEGKPVKRRYFFMTMLRDPVKRFLSEFWHLRRFGQTAWTSSRHWSCSEQEPLQPTTCLDNLQRLSLHDFIHCSHNLAINRQTHMLSDLSLVGCHNASSLLSEEDRDLILLTSAKNNLHKMSFFGLSEFPRVSQYMFEATFGLAFRTGNSLLLNSALPPRGSSYSTARRRRKELLREITSKDMEAVRRANRLDTELYRYAKELLFYRFEKLKKVDPSFENYSEFLAKDGNVSQEEEEEDWADREDFLDNLTD